MIVLQFASYKSKTPPSNAILYRESVSIYDRCHRVIIAYSKPHIIIYIFVI